MANKKTRIREDNRVSFLYFITLSTYPAFWRRYKSLEQAYYALRDYIDKIIKSLREWAKKRKAVFKIELWVVMAPIKSGKYKGLCVPHAHGIISGNYKMIIEYICKKWKEHRLGYGRFITDLDGHKKLGNVFVEPIDDTKSYGGKYGIDGCIRYSIDQQGMIKIGEEEGELQGKSLRWHIRPQHSTRGRDYLKSKSWQDLHQIDIGNDSKYRDLDSFYRTINVPSRQCR